MDKIYVSILGAAEALNLSRSKIYELLADGTLKSRKEGRRRLVYIESVLHYAKGA